MFSLGTFRKGVFHVTATIRIELTIGKKKFVA